jgi:hypothetical protein
MFDITKAKKEIEDRNRLRVEAELPSISMVRELRRLHTIECEREFEEFFQTSPLRKRVETRLLARQRRLRRDSEWRPTGMLSGGGLAFYALTRNVMGRVWCVRRRLGQ